jgi:hypothetical protein
MLLGRLDPATAPLEIGITPEEQQAQQEEMHERFA